MPGTGGSSDRPGSPLTRRVTTTFAVGLCLLLVFLGWNWIAARHRTPLQGRVSVDGKPITFGVVTVITAGGETLTTQIRPDGTYLLPHVPAGQVRFAVASPEPRTVFQKAIEPGAASFPPRSPAPPGLPPGGDGDVGDSRVAPDAGRAIAMSVEGGPPSSQPAVRPEHAAWFRVPGRYANPLRSGLSGSVSAGGSTIDLDLSAAEPGK
jgi:hypothetical protein